MRIVIVGGPRCGKSTLARQLRAEGLPTYCGDPLSLVKEPEAGVTYLPEGLGWSEGSLYVAEHWLTLPGPWVMEGQIMARALRKWLAGDSVFETPSPLPCDRVIVLTKPHEAAHPTPGQLAMGKAVQTVWREVCGSFDHLAEYR